MANAVYWMNRYVERAENVARFVDVNLHLALDLPEGAVEQWAPLVVTTGDDESFSAKYAAASRANVMRFLTFDPDYPSSILSCLRAARENARSVREIISSEMWEAINEAYLFVSSAARSSDEVLAAPHDFYAQIKRAAQTYLGVCYVTMTHNEAWHFARMARLIERADKTSRILDVKYFLLLPDPGDVGSPYDEIQWAALLKSASAFEMYRKRWGPITPARVIEFLLLDPKFPRSTRYCVTKADRSLHAITGRPLGATDTPAEQHLGRLRTELEHGEVQEVVARGVHEHVDAFQAKLNTVSSAIHETFFGR